MSKHYPAFPVPSEFASMHNKDGTQTVLVGMSMRDYVAVEMLKVLIANDETTHEEDIECALLIADKFLKARGE